jgi:hypothetical protein
MVNQPQQSTANSWKETLVVATNCCPAMADRYGRPLSVHHPPHCLRFESAPAANGDTPCSNGTSRFLTVC